MTDDAFKEMHNRIAKASFVTALNDVLTRNNAADVKTLYMCLLEVYLMGHKDSQNRPPAWTETWPTDVGWFWFYGTWTQNDVDARLSVVKVRQGPGDMLFYVVDGATGFRNAGSRGLWLPLCEPELPHASVCSAHQTPVAGCPMCGVLTPNIRIMHWDTFDDTTVEIGRAYTVEGAEIIVMEKYEGRLATSGADRVEIVLPNGDVARSWSTG